MIRRYTVEEIYAAPGFAEMVAEYALMADPDMPAPTFRKDDYQAIEQSDRLGVYGAMDRDKLVGFVAVVKGYLPKFGVPVAITESIFVLKKYRTKGYGIRLLQATEDYARVNGLQHCFVNIPDHAVKSLGLVLLHRNYSAKIHTYGKVLW